MKFQKIKENYKNSSDAVRCYVCGRPKEDASVSMQVWIYNNKQSIKDYSNQDFVLVCNLPCAQIVNEIRLQAKGRNISAPVRKVLDKCHEKFYGTWEDVDDSFDELFNTNNNSSLQVCSDSYEGQSLIEFLDKSKEKTIDEDEFELTLAFFPHLVYDNMSV